MATTAFVYSSDSIPGIRRVGRTRFSYVDERSGDKVPASGRERIERLAIPPAWTNVWISPDPLAHLQATGRDAKGRKQYRYHAAFQADRSATKFAGLADFATRLGGLRRQVAVDLADRRLEHDHVVAVVVRMLDVTCLRVGNVQYARTNESFGLTTLLNEHVSIRGSKVRLQFRGKSAHEFDVAVEDAQLARLVRRLHDLPGHDLFQYRDELGELRPIGSSDVNEYLQRHGWEGGTAKVFRTWGASALAGELLAEASSHETPTKVSLNAALREVAGMLGNTLAVCRGSYVHPTLIDSYLEGSLDEKWRAASARTPNGLTAAERRVLKLIRR